MNVLFDMRSALTFAALLTATPPVFAEGDVEYGEYLSSECVTCHQGNVNAGQIPSIHGMNREGFVEIMKLYREKVLDNPTMQTVAKRLTDEDIEALGAFFSTQPAPE